MDANWPPAIAHATRRALGLGGQLPGDSNECAGSRLSTAADGRRLDDPADRRGGQPVFDASQSKAQVLPGRHTMQTAASASWFALTWPSTPKEFLDRLGQRLPLRVWKRPRLKADDRPTLAVRGQRRRLLAGFRDLQFCRRR